MDSDVGSDDFTTASLWNLGILRDKSTRSAALCEGSDNVLLALEDRANLGALGLDDDGDLVLDRLAVGGQVVQTDNGSGGADRVVGQVKVGSSLGEVVLGSLSRLASCALASAAWRTGTHLLGERGVHDTLARVLGTSGQTLPQVLGDEWHVRVEQLETSFKTCVECVLRRELFGRLTVGLE